MAQTTYCSGSIAVSADETFAAISTLQQSIVTYTLSVDGPVPGSKVEVKYEESTDYRPIVPVALTSNNLVLKGTVSDGMISILDTRTGTTSSLKHGQRQTIRTLTTLGDKVLVGSTDVSGDIHSSCSIKCYSSLVTEQQGDPKPMFRIAWSTVRPLEAGRSWHFSITGAPWTIVRHLHLSMQHHKAWIGFIVFLLLSAIMAMSPSGKAVSMSNVTDVAVYEPIGPQDPTRPQNPTLRRILYHMAYYMVTQMAALAAYTALFVKGRVVSMVQFTVSMVVFGMKWSFQAVCFIPRSVTFMLNEVPNLIATMICDILREHALSDICSEAGAR
ncbi:hypothetical protein FS749_008555 [Ceratobasidium sp. UAMH 11750]|nr:hypothetical protein FS749_008555 [Ceratobasidium sp. UAMH 11750]